MAVMMMLMIIWGQVLVGNCIVKYCASNRYDTDAAPSMGQELAGRGLASGLPEDDHRRGIGVLRCRDRDPPPQLGQTPRAGL